MSTMMGHWGWRLLLCLVLVPGAGLARAAGDDPWAPGTFGGGERFALGVGSALVRFDVNAKFTDKTSGKHIYVDTEGTFDLPAVSTVATYYGSYRFNDHHSMGFSYFNVRRGSTLLGVDGQFGDWHVNGEASIMDTTDFLMLQYGYTLMQDARSLVNLLLGIYTIDMGYTFEASGEISDDNGLVVSDSMVREVGVTAPLPLLGVDMLYELVPDWVLSTNIALVGGRYKEISALVLQTTVQGRYRFTRHVGGVLGITYFSADVDVDEERQNIKVGYGYDGAFLGLHFIW